MINCIKSLFNINNTVELLLPRSILISHSFKQLINIKAVECSDLNPHCLLPKMSLSVKTDVAVYVVISQTSLVLDLMSLFSIPGYDLQCIN